MYQYLKLIPFGIIYFTLFFVLIPRIEGKGAKAIVILLLIPIAYFLAGYFDQYLPNLFNRIARTYDF